MAKDRTHVVKRYHSGGDSVVMTGSEEACQDEERKLFLEIGPGLYKVPSRVHPLTGEYIEIARTDNTKC